MRRARRVVPTVLAGLVFVAVVAGGRAMAGPDTDARADAILGPGDVTITLTVHHSRFAPDHLRVRPGTNARFVLHNEDPIGHEFIVGDDEVHRRHEAGTEPVHPPRPGEVSVPALSTAETTFAFAGSSSSGSVVYACHLPGHFKYGMSGVVDVVPG